MQANLNSVEPISPTHAQMPAPTAGARGEVPDYPKDLYDAAHIENGHINFNNAIMAVRAPNHGKPEYVPPPIPAAIAEATKREMEAGAKRVAEFAEQKAAQQAIAKRTPEPWEGKSTAVFRPGDVSEYRAGLKSPAQTPSKDNVRQPVARQ